MAGRRGSKQGQLRIIGGEWRSRRFSFTAAAGLRPTTDRVRETLFNWLAPALPGARCADLFAGSGALGLEALSRGAAHCCFCDSSAAVIADISKHLLTLNGTDRAACHRGEAVQLVRDWHAQWDIVFLDPPFGSALAGPVCEQLQAGQRLADGAFVYLETDPREGPVPVPPAWRLHREKQAGGVAYRLYQAPAFVTPDQIV